jgi:hypothetical protein
MSKESPASDYRNADGISFPHSESGVDLRPVIAEKIPGKSADSPASDPVGEGPAETIMHPDGRVEVKPMNTGEHGHEKK